MTAAVYVPEARQGWWGGADLRPRCSTCDKVAFTDQAAAERSAEKIRARGEARMSAYLGPCGNWHVGRGKRQRRA